MKTAKKPESQNTANMKPEVKSFSKYHNARMVTISGNFKGGSFNLSQNKIKAVIENLDILKDFASGRYDKSIDELKDDEILEM